MLARSHLMLIELGVGPVVRGQGNVVHQPQPRSVAEMTDYFYTVRCRS